MGAQGAMRGKVRHPGEVLDVRAQIAAGFRRIVSGDPNGQPEWVRALRDGTDEGYFGPGSAPWAVHGSLPTLVGGIRALLLQALHPGALAGVTEHSRYEQDALGRLEGTTRWLTVVTFGDRAAADRECARVRGMHRKVSGNYTVSGVEHSYSAMDPNLLRWVHVAFTDSFLATHERWGAPIPGGANAYVCDWAIAGELVGVTNPPRTRAELKDSLANYEPYLIGDERTHATVDFIRNPPLPVAALPAYSILFAGAVSTLPQRYREMLGVPNLPEWAITPSVRALLAGMQFALGNNPPAMGAALERISRIDQAPADVRA